MARLASILFVLTMLLSGTGAFAQEMKFFRIGTGGAGGTYFPIGGMIAHAISNPPGSRPCDEGGSCGVPGLIAIAQSSNGSVANINAIRSDTLESGFVQADVAYWAYTGTAIYQGKGKVENLRAIASLYPESLHLVIRNGADIHSLGDLKGKKISLDEPGSGTLVAARLLLNALGLSEQDLQPQYIKPTPALAKIRDGSLDAFFIVAGYPTESVMELAATTGCSLLPIEDPRLDALLETYKFFSRDTIPAETYEGIGETKTLSVGALWVAGANVDEQLIYQITKALWNDNTRELLDQGHDKGNMITLETALDSLSIPLHPGAERYYKEIGQL